MSTFMQKLAADAAHTRATTARFGASEAQMEHLSWVNDQITAKLDAARDGMAAIIDATIAAYMAVNDVSFDKLGTGSGPAYGDAKPYHDFVAKLAGLESSHTKAANAAARIVDDCIAAHPPQGCGDYHFTAHLLAALTFQAQTGRGGNAQQLGRNRATVDAVERYLVLEGEAVALERADILDVLQQHFGIDFTVHVVTETNRLGRDEVVDFITLDAARFDFPTAFNAQEVRKFAAMAERYNTAGTEGTDINGVQCGEYDDREDAQMPDTFEMAQRHAAGNF